MLEKTGSLIHWTRLDDDTYDKHLRLKLVEESHEVCQAKTKEELGLELADILEIIDCICNVNALSFDEVRALQEKKRAERGSFVERKYVTVAEHPDDSQGLKYCLCDPDKYPEIVTN